MLGTDDACALRLHNPWEKENLRASFLARQVSRSPYQYPLGTCVPSHAHALHYVRYNVTRYGTVGSTSQARRPMRLALPV